MTQTVATVFPAAWGSWREGTEVFSISFVVNQAMIDRYADVSGDRNPIHIDPVFAAASPLGGTIAHGLWTMSIAGRLLDRWSDGCLSRSGDMDFAFIGPVPAGVTMVIRGFVTSSDAESVSVELRCSVQDRPVLIGNVRIETTEGGEMA